MTWDYAYTPQIWPSFLTVLLLIALSIYSGHRRGVAGALQFTIACLFAAAWAACWVMEAAALNQATKINWVKVQGIFSLSIIIAITCFFLEYAWPGRWLTRHNMILLSIPCLLLLGLSLTNDLHHLMWQGFAYEGKTIPLRGPANWIFVAYAFLGLGILNLIVFAWLFARSPQHRWPVALMLTGQIVGRTAYILDAARVLHSALPINVLGMAFEFLIYTIALFGFRIFDPIPLARQTAIEQLRAGMLVLDPKGRIVSLNPAAGAILGSPTKRLLGLPIQDILPSCAGLVKDLQAAGVGPAEISLGIKAETRFYQLEASALKDWRGLAVGLLFMLHDITEQKQAQAQLLEQQRALAMFSERERLARELHDGIGQVLGYVKLQAQAAREWLAQDQKLAADNDLEKLITVAQEAHSEVREYILGAKSAASDQPGFLPMLQQYLQRFSEHYALRTELIAPPSGIDGAFEPTVEAQLLRIIQEALTNARKHAQAHCIQVLIQMNGCRAQVVVRDDGSGFDPDLLVDGGGQKYGLGFMRERADEIGGSIEIHSALGKGTEVIVNVPLQHSEMVT